MPELRKWHGVISQHIIVYAETREEAELFLYELNTMPTGYIPDSFEIEYLYETE